MEGPSYYRSILCRNKRSIEHADDTQEIEAQNVQLVLSCAARDVQQIIRRTDERLRDILFPLPSIRAPAAADV